VRLIAVAVCAVVLLAAGARYFLLRDARITTEQSVASLTRRTSAALAVFRKVSGTRTGADRANTITQTERDRVLALAVGDGSAIASLRAVDTPCRAVGIQ
jgi:hypothetical protein